MNICIVNSFPCKKNTQPGNGSELRVALLSKFFATLPEYTIRVVGTDKTPFFKREGNITFEDALFPSSFLMRLALFIIQRVLTRVPKFPAIGLIARYLLPCYDRRFMEKLEEAVVWADVVIIEQIYNGRAAMRLCKKHGKCAVASTHNVEADLWISASEPKWIRRWSLELELNTLREATYAVACSEADAAVFRHHGLEMIKVIDNPVDTFTALPDERTVNHIRQKFSVNEQSAFFIGGPAGHNVEGATLVCMEIAPQLPEYTFFILGSVCGSLPPSVLNKIGKNVRLVGSVSDGEMRAFYMLCPVVLVPLRHGSGTSLKLIEALGYGKTILTTSIGARGIKFEHGVHGLVCNDMAAYPQLIRSLTAADRERFAVAAKELAEVYDYRTVFKKYLPMLAGAGHAGRAAAESKVSANSNAR
ncbi:MAG: glycosyltransferase family 4 protein [Rhizobacter sp.]|nr:glycosyltransferase family 4 protein [Chlorobiales bacterium]